MCKSISPSEVKDIFTAPEISILAKTPLNLIGSMDSLSRSLILLQTSSDIISMFGRELAIEWTDKENLPAVYKAIDSLESLCIRIRNNAILEQPTITGNTPKLLHFFSSKFDCKQFSFRSRANDLS